MSRPNISYPTPLPGSSSYSSVNADTSLASSSTSERRGNNMTTPNPGPSQGARSVSSSSRTPGGTLDSNITRLLVTTKHMLQGLESWSQGSLDEEGVSDIYVRLGNQFELCLSAFQDAGISTLELDSIPTDLRHCLEACLNEEPCSETLNLHLPQVRNIIYGLLNGLKQKQAVYKRLASERGGGDSVPSVRRQVLAQQAPPLPPPSSTSAQQLARPIPRAESAEARLSARSNTSASLSQGSASPASITSPLPAGKTLADRPRPVPQTRPAPPDAFRPPRMRAPEGGQPPTRSISPNPSPVKTTHSSIPNNTMADGLIRHQLSDNPVPVSTPPPDTLKSLPPRSGPTPPPKATPPPRPERFSRDSMGNPRAISRFSADSDITNASPIRSPARQSPKKRMSSLSEAGEAAPAPPPPPPPPSSALPTQPSLPPSLPTLNFPSSALHLSDAPSLEPAPQLADVPPESRATLAALSRSDALERRASKRFSSYTFNKLPGSPTQKKSSMLGSPQQRPPRRMDKPPPMPSLSESAASRTLQSAYSEGGKTPSSNSVDKLDPSSASSHHSISPMSGSLDLSPSDQEGSIRSFRTPDPSFDPSPQLTPRVFEPTATPKPSPDSLTVFLQVGRQVKKVVLDLPVSLSALRLLFMEKFEYDPGMEDFPDVYLRDSQTGVQYELEDIDDLKEGCLLSLNIEPLDQVKQHFDVTFANLMQEIKEMKKSVDQQRRMSAVPNPALLALSPSAHTPRAMPFAAARSPEPRRPVSPVPAINGPERTAELQAHQDEISSLRQDLAVLRQIHVDFITESKEALSKLRKENSSMRDLVKTKMGGSRALLDNSKTKLESLCADTIQAVEEISDTIDSAREDAFRRFVTPSSQRMATIRADLQKAHELVDSFAKEVSTVEPTWRATWHQELSRVMDEQRLLPHQSKLTVDLKNDIQDAENMLQNLQDFVNQRAASAGRNPSRGFRPPTPDPDGGIPNLLMEIRTKESDPNQRLKAIEAQQKAREKERANKTDEFEQELTGFVKGRKLRKTGGTEETERKTQRRQDQMLKRMLTGETPPNGSGTGGQNSPTGGLLSPQIAGKSVNPLSPQLTGQSIREEHKGE
ncbi:actin interacting protein 3-domain-containing protein [Kockovaella imperatae]|uniref:Actin interacting protein 3-domain-containing protein n=1 Tax=Kockovaella imperatae TaxID=4999 RepID=A0A1Y1U691_9TREE|nr:actin interacting protein 3-domain-containing protein [Kockovaella imperatae]ORX33551.1 actin interacting protein 3-domain-containing protein [Kockovaella imperatae]